MPAPAKKVSDSVTEISQLMMPQHANQAGTVFGGTILALADSVAYVCAARHAGPHCVTVSVDRVDFHEPIKIGDLVTCFASVNYVGRSSMEIGIKIYSENFKSGKKRHTNSCYVTMVGLDEKGRPAEVPRLILETEEEKRRYKEGERRREHTKSLQKKNED